MLYERWLQTTREHTGETALRDLASGRNWTFAQLATSAEQSGFADRDAPIRFPQGGGCEFVFEVLRAWRENKIVCPLESGQPRPILEKLPPGIAHLKTTSATSGSARLVAFTEDQIAADADNVVATMGLRRDWPNLGVISLAHSYGFSNLVTPLLLHGIPLILVPTPLPEILRHAATSEAALTLPAVPALWRAWHEAEAIPPNVKLGISAGAPLSLALEQDIFAQRGLKIHNFYGASECGGIAFDASESPRTEAACVGSPMRNVSLSIANDGCLDVRSAAVAETYWPQSDASLCGGCFHTSDLAEIHGETVFLRGRTGDRINVAGRKVSPETVEQALLKHPRVSECLVFGVPSRDVERNEEIVAVLVSAEREESLRELLLESLPSWQIPRHWWFVEKMQVNARGKFSRAEWRTRWLERSR